MNLPIPSGKLTFLPINVDENRKFQLLKILTDALGSIAQKTLVSKTISVSANLTYRYLRCD